MSIFEPRTFSTDWEVMVLDRLNRWIDIQRCEAFAGALRSELDLPIHVDWDTVEFGLGICTSFDQFWQRARKATDRAAEIVREFDLDLFPSGANPVSMHFNASHLHVGSVHDESEAIHLENQLLQYVPVFAALSANSPFWNRAMGEYKSYRVQHLAHDCTVPSSVRDPDLSQMTWGADAGPKLYSAPTMEVRVLDCACSRRLLAEMATFVAAFLHQQGEEIRHERPTRQQYRAALTNRWAAARYGMQATFVWDGSFRPVAEILDEMIEQCSDSLEALGTRPRDLELIEAMIGKRICQADLGLGLMDRYQDPHLLVSAYSKLLRHWEIFEDYLADAPVLEPAPAPDEERILEEHLAHVGEHTHFYRIRGVMYYPAPVSDQIIEEMVRRGLVTREVTTTRGVLLHRVE